MIKNLKKITYLFADYFLLLFSPITKKFDKKVTFKYLDLINSFYSLRCNEQAIVNTHHETLEIFRETYDLQDQHFYDKFLGENWFKNKSILDIGCFVGGKSYLLAKNGAKNVVGIDLSHRGIETASKYNDLDNLTYYALSSSDDYILKKYADSFDYIISFTVFEHIDENFLLDVINDAYRLLKNGGKFVIVYNHINDRFGGHLKHYIPYPWPQFITNFNHSLEYCDMKLSGYHKTNQMLYYPKEYQYIKSEHNSDCYMSLNKLDRNAFESIIIKSLFASNFTSIPYSRYSFPRFIYDKFNWPQLFHPSYVYILNKT